MLLSNVESKFLRLWIRARYAQRIRSFGALPPNFPKFGAPVNQPCKICGNDSPVFASVNFNKSCEIADGLVLPNSLFEVTYNQCLICSFVFTTDFDNWSAADFREFIYNDDYVIVDPGYLGIRARENASKIFSLFSSQFFYISTLDYGGGNGTFARILRKYGFLCSDFYDPFSMTAHTLPTKKYNLVTSFETLEHAVDPLAVISDMTGLLKDDGVVLFSTLLQGKDFAKNGLEWWYAGPRNGHISLFSQESLKRAWEKFGFQIYTVDSGFHFAVRGTSPLLNEEVKRYFGVLP